MDNPPEPSIEERIAQLRKRLGFQRGRGPRRWFESQYAGDALVPLPRPNPALPSKASGQPADWADTGWPQTEWLDTVVDP